MTLEEAIQILEKHNAWRRGNIEDMPEKDTKNIGVAIDIVLHAAKLHALKS